MRVLVVPKWYPWPERPVFGIFCREQARAIARQHDVIVLASEAVKAPGFAVFELSDADEDGLRTLRVRYRRPRFRPAAMGCQILGMLVALRRLRRQDWRPEVVHAHVYSAGLPALILGAVSGAKVLVSEHYTGFQRGLVTGYDRFTARLVFRHVDLVAPVSDDLARYVQALQPRATVRVVPNVVDTEVFHPAAEGQRQSSARGSARLLTVGALVPKKGQADLLESLALLRREREVTLDLVGEGESHGELEQRARELGLGAAVRFDGERPKEEVAEFMRHADLFVLPSLFENLPCVLIEAMASGLPFIATAVGGIPDLVAETGGGLCPPHDPQALAAAIACALDDPAEIDREALAEEARRHFGYEAIAGIWTEIYEELVSNAGTTS
jgi:glycosyltransferase involved in cell wall biosynthesis